MCCCTNPVMVLSRAFFTLGYFDAVSARVTLKCHFRRTQRHLRFGECKSGILTSQKQRTRPVTKISPDVFSVLFLRFSWDNALIGNPDLRSVTRRMLNLVKHSTGVIDTADRRSAVLVKERNFITNAIVPQILSRLPG